MAPRTAAVAVAGRSPSVPRASSERHVVAVAQVWKRCGDRGEGFKKLGVGNGQV